MLGCWRKTATSLRLEKEVLRWGGHGAGKGGWDQTERGLEQKAFGWGMTCTDLSPPRTAMLSEQALRTHSGTGSVQPGPGVGASGGKLPDAVCSVCPQTEVCALVHKHGQYERHAGKALW